MDRIKHLAVFVALFCVSQAALAAKSNLLTMAENSTSALLEGTRIVAGDPSKNEFFIVGKAVALSEPKEAEVAKSDKPKVIVENSAEQENKLSQLKNAMKAAFTHRPEMKVLATKFTAAKPPKTKAIVAKTIVHKKKLPILFAHHSKLKLKQIANKHALIHKQSAKTKKIAQKKPTKKQGLVG